MKKLSLEEGIAVCVALAVIFGLLFWSNLVFQSNARAAQDQRVMGTEEGGASGIEADTVSVVE